MKTTLLTLTALALLAAPAASAQVEFGLKAGLNVASISGNNPASQSPRLGFVGGGFARVPLTATGMVALQPEVLFSMKGENSEPSPGLQRDFRLDYLEVPVLARLGIPTGSPLEVGVIAGPTLGIPLRAQVEEVLVSGTASTTRNLNARTPDVGLALGADVGSGPFSVDLRYTLGLTDATSPEPERINRVFSVTAGYRF